MANQTRLNDKVTFSRQYSSNKVCLKDMAQESNKYQGKGITGTSPTASWSPLQQNKTHPNTYHSPISPFEKKSVKVDAVPLLGMGHNCLYLFMYSIRCLI